jgi:mRNA interferase RelE/StbE
MSKVVIHRDAANYLKRLPEATRNRIKALLKELEYRPTDHRRVKPMLGDWAGYHRLRVGKFRVIFWFDQRDDVVYIDHIGPRGDIFK